MSEVWQQGIIILVLVAAVAYLAQRLITWRRRRKACSECKLIKQISVRAEKTTDKSSTN